MAARIRSVCLIHCSLAGAFADLGVAVTSLAPPGGTASLPHLLATLPEPPDCVIHQEHLGKRFILTDLDAAPCPTIFWAQDPHLNFFWQRHYARQFSATASTQPHLTEPFAAAGAPRAAWITWHGRKRPFVPFAQRGRDLAFVGRITPTRRRRQWFAAHLAAFGLA
ncbi:MAG: glycosyltransferase family 1 protein, partial [Acidobacteriota bacterium]